MSKYEIKILAHPNIQKGFEELAVSDGFVITNTAPAWTEYTLEGSEETSLKDFLLDLAVLYKDAFRLVSAKRLDK